MRPIFKILMIFLTWRFILVVISLLAIYFVPLGYKDRFLGGGSQNFGISPQLFAWANFDGEHYLSISIFGYKFLEQAFFPIYPMLISFFSKPNSADLITSLINTTIVGLIISNVSLLLSLMFLFELIKIDFSKKIAFITVTSLLVFPTSFYFGSLYNESLFLFLSVLSFYLARKKKWFLSGIFGMLSGATRVFGILLLPALFIEVLTQKEKISKAFWIFLIPAGLGLYMLYQYINFGDPFAFYNLQTVVGEQHQRGIVTLPQVYFRYLKMIFTVDKLTPLYQTIVLEFVVGVLFFIIPIYGYFKKIRLSYLFYAITGFLLPSIQGSFSSSPRYVIVLFPSFLALAIFWSGLSRIPRIIFLTVSLVVLVVETTLFLRGYWVA